MYLCEHAGLSGRNNQARKRIFSRPDFFDEGKSEKPVIFLDNKWLGFFQHQVIIT
jgi:hypothetical protein